MFNVGDKVRVVKDEFQAGDLEGKQGVVSVIDETQESCNIVVTLEDFTPQPIDVFMCEVLDYPANSIPFSDSELELI